MICKTSESAAQRKKDDKRCCSHKTWEHWWMTTFRMSQNLKLKPTPKIWGEKRGFCDMTEINCMPEIRQEKEQKAKKSSCGNDPFRIGNSLWDKHCERTVERWKT